MVQVKKKRTDLEVPDWVKKQWEKGTVERNQMCTVLEDCNWDKAGRVNGEPRFSTLCCYPTLYLSLNKCDPFAPYGKFPDGPLGLGCLQ